MHYVANRVMQPGIQYATTSDGARIAFCTRGEGAPLVVLPDGPWSTIDFEWKFPVHRSWFEELATSRRIVRYDNRGTGLSDPADPRFELESQVRQVTVANPRLEHMLHHFHHHLKDLLDLLADQFVLGAQLHG